MVVDANVLAAWFLERGPRHARTRIRLGAEPIWKAPPIWRTEFLSVLRKYMQHAGLSREAALIAHAEADNELATQDPPDAALVLDLSTQKGCSVYDAEYVASAIIAGTRLLTFDRVLLDRFPGLAVEP